VTIWGSSSSWTLTALPLFIWMGEILFRTRCRATCSRPGAVAAVAAGAPIAYQRGRLRDLRRVSGSSAATCATIGKMSCRTVGVAATRRHRDRLAGRAGTLGLLIPPSSSYRLRRRGRGLDRATVHGWHLPASCWRVVFGYLALWALRHPGQVPAAIRRWFRAEAA